MFTSKINEVHNNDIWFTISFKSSTNKHFSLLHFFWQIRKKIRSLIKMKLHATKSSQELSQYALCHSNSTHLLITHIHVSSATSQWQHASGAKNHHYWGVLLFRGFQDDGRGGCGVQLVGQFSLSKQLIGIKKKVNCT